MEGRRFVRVLEEGTARLVELPETGEVLIGRGDDAALKLRVSAASRRHALLVVDENGVVVRDLGSRNGTSLNGQPLASEARVQSGDIIGICDVTLVVYRTYRIRHRSVIVADPAMARLYALLEELARADRPVLITGETGSGKELAATLLHESSPRRDRPLLALNCAAFQEHLVESELFGFEEGAFSGALEAKPGLFEVAAGGTVFLDEIGELPLSVQGALLRVLDTRRLTRMGAPRERAVDVRVVAATNRNLQQEVVAGRFHPTLFQRLGAATLAIPPLRDRPREIGLLAELFLSEAARSGARSPITMTAEATAALAAHPWPGNVRELKNVMEFCSATLDGSRLTAAHLAGSPLRRLHDVRK